jgi:Glycosyl hydrolases family 18
MKRRLFIQSGSAAAVLALAGCGGGGGGGSADAGNTGDAATGTALAAAPVAAPAVGALPSSILACYFTAWDTTYKITDVPADFNVIYLFHATPTAAQNGTAEFKYGGAVSGAQVQACRNRGQKVILTFGGAGLGFNFSSRSQSQNFISSIQPIIASLGGVDGLDFNNFEANVQSSATEMIWMAQQLRALYGSSFAITAPPNPNAPSDMAMLKAMNDAGVLSYQGGQYYDWDGFDNVDFIVARVDQWCAAVGADKTMIGFTGFDYAVGVSRANQLLAWAAIKAKHPTIRGMFCWSAQSDLAAANQWGSTMKPLVLG